MTKKGYTHIIVPTALHSRLKHLSQEANLSIAKFIELSINTSINTNQQNASKTPLSPIEKEGQNNPYLRNGSSVNASSQEGLVVGPKGFEPLTSGSEGLRISSAPYPS